MSSVPADKVNIRTVIEQLFPWVAGFVAIAGAKGKNLAIRAAGGLIHLAGGPDDPAVHRVGDHSPAGSILINVYGPASMAGPPSTVLITYTDPDGVPQVVPVTGLTTTADAGPFTITLTAKAGEGSKKVTCA